MDSLSPLVEEIASSSDPIREIPREKSPTNSDEARGVQAPLHGGGEDASKQGDLPNWWATKGFLADPCAALVSTLPQELLSASKGKANPLEAWWKQYFVVKHFIFALSSFPF
jgi:hypothetical protein